MKKIFIIGIVMILILCGCSNNETNEYTGSDLRIEEKRRIELYNKSNKKDIVITDEVAIDIGNAVMKSIYGEEIFNDTKYLLEYYKQDAAYIFTRIPLDRETLGCPYYEIAISKIDGAILGIWQ